MHQDKYVYSVFDALSLGETNCTLERAMERWTQLSTTCQNCIKQTHCQFHTKKKIFLKKFHASIHVKTMQLDHSRSKETIGKWRTSKPALRQPTSCPKWAPLFQSSCWKQAGEWNSKPEVPPREGPILLKHSLRKVSSHLDPLLINLWLSSEWCRAGKLCLCQPSLFCWEDFLTRVSQCFHDNK